MVDVKDALLPLQIAIVTRLKGDTPLVALATGGIFDNVPINKNFPYIEVGDFVEGEWRTHGRPGAEVAVTISIWSDAKGNKEGLLIKNELGRLMGDILDNQISVSGFFVNAIWFSGSTTIKELIDGARVVRHIVCRYRAKLQQD